MLIPRRLGVSLVIAVALAAAAARTPARATEGYGRCSPVGTPVFHSPQIIVFEGRFVEHDAYVACWRATGHRLVFARVTSGGQTRVYGFQAAGAWLVWETYTGQEPDSTATLRSINVLSQRHGPTVSAPRLAGVGPTDGQPPELGGAHIMVITANGSYAWVIRDVSPAPGAAPVDALYIPTGSGGDRRLDDGPLGSITGLRAQGDVIYWRHDGRKRSARLK